MRLLTAVMALLPLRRSLLYDCSNGNKTTSKRAVKKAPARCFFELENEAVLE